MMKVKEVMTPVRFPDGFYLGFTCHGCNEIIEIIIDDASDGCRFVANDLLHILCRGCGELIAPSRASRQ